MITLQEQNRLLRAYKDAQTDDERAAIKAELKAKSNLKLVVANNGAPITQAQIDRFNSRFANNMPLSALMEETIKATNSTLTTPSTSGRKELATYMHNVVVLPLANSANAIMTQTIPTGYGNTAARVDQLKRFLTPIIVQNNTFIAEMATLNQRAQELQKLLDYAKSKAGALTSLDFTNPTLSLEVAALDTAAASIINGLNTLLETAITTYNTNKTSINDLSENLLPTLDATTVVEATDEATIPGTLTALTTSVNTDPFAMTTVFTAINDLKTSWSDTTLPSGNYLRDHLVWNDLTTAFSTVSNWSAECSTAAEFTARIEHFNALSTAIQTAIDAVKSILSDTDTTTADAAETLRDANTLTNDEWTQLGLAADTATISLITPLQTTTDQDYNAATNKTTYVNEQETAIKNLFGTTKIAGVLYDTTANANRHTLAQNSLASLHQTTVDQAASDSAFVVSYDATDKSELEIARDSATAFDTFNSALNTIASTVKTTAPIDTTVANSIPEPDGSTLTTFNTTIFAPLNAASEGDVKNALLALTKADATILNTAITTAQTTYTTQFDLNIQLAKDFGVTNLATTNSETTEAQITSAINTLSYADLTTLAAARNTLATTVTAKMTARGDDTIGATLTDFSNPSYVPDLSLNNLNTIRNSINTFVQTRKDLIDTFLADHNQSIELYTDYNMASGTGTGLTVDTAYATTATTDAASCQTNLTNLASTAMGTLAGRFIDTSNFSVSSQFVSGPPKTFFGVAEANDWTHFTNVKNALISSSFYTAGAASPLETLRSASSTALATFITNTTVPNILFGSVFAYTLIATGADLTTITTNIDNSRVFSEGLDIQRDIPLHGPMSLWESASNRPTFPSNFSGITTDSATHTATNLLALSNTLINFDLATYAGALTAALSLVDNGTGRSLLNYLSDGQSITVNGVTIDNSTGDLSAFTTALSSLAHIETFIQKITEASINATFSKFDSNNTDRSVAATLQKEMFQAILDGYWKAKMADNTTLMTALKTHYYTHHNRQLAEKINLLLDWSILICNVKDAYTNVASTETTELATAIVAYGKAESLYRAYIFRNEEKAKLEEWSTALNSLINLAQNNTSTFTAALTSIKNYGQKALYHFMTTIYQPNLLAQDLTDKALKYVHYKVLHTLYSAKESQIAAGSIFNSWKNTYEAMQSIVTLKEQQLNAQTIITAARNGNQASIDVILNQSDEVTSALETLDPSLQELVATYIAALSSVITKKSTLMTSSTSVYDPSLSVLKTTQTQIATASTKLNAYQAIFSGSLTTLNTASISAITLCQDKYLTQLAQSLEDLYTDILNLSSNSSGSLSANITTVAQTVQSFVAPNYLTSISTGHLVGFVPSTDVNYHVGDTFAPGNYLADGSTWLAEASTVLNGLIVTQDNTLSAVNTSTGLPSYAASVTLSATLTNQLISRLLETFTIEALTSADFASIAINSGIMNVRKSKAALQSWKESVLSAGPVSLLITNGSANELSSFFAPNDAVDPTTLLNALLRTVDVRTGLTFKLRSESNGISTFSGNDTLLETAVNDPYLGAVLV